MLKKFRNFTGNVKRFWFFCFYALSMQKLNLLAWKARETSLLQLLFFISILNINTFLANYRDADDTKAWISEKDTALSTSDYGRDLASVQALQRKHEVLERDLAALEEKVWYWGLLIENQGALSSLSDGRSNWHLGTRGKWWRWGVV